MVCRRWPRRRRAWRRRPQLEEVQTRAGTWIKIIFELQHSTRGPRRHLAVTFCDLPRNLSKSSLAPRESRVPVRSEKRFVGCPARNIVQPLHKVRARRFRIVSQVRRIGAFVLSVVLGLKK